MEDFKLECLPILIVSAKDQNSVRAIITELIEDDNPERCSGENSIDYVWRLVNKYYTADVRLHALLDGQELDEQLVDSVEAHLIYISNEECADPDAAEVLRRRARAVRAAPVRVVAADADARGAGALAAASRAARLELVPLREPPDAPDAPDAADAGDERDECGVARVRDAFHAHVWPGLVRRGAADPVESGDSDEEWSAWCSGPVADDAFAAALGALPAAAAAAAAAAASGATRDERLARAEHLVAAFCRALGSPLD